MDKNIYSYIQLFEELEEKIQMVTKEQIYSLPGYDDIHLLGNPNEIKDYVDRVIRIMTTLENQRSDVKKDGIDEGYYDESNYDL